MCAFAPDFDGASAGFSPDRVDALVWAFADLLVEQMSNEGSFRSQDRATDDFTLKGVSAQHTS